MNVDRAKSEQLGGWESNCQIVVVRFEDRSEAQLRLKPNRKRSKHSVRFSLKSE